jgi:hypothetical protein
MKFRNLIALLVLVLVSSCGSKKASVDDRPSWVKTRPLSDTDYVGIAKSSKVQTPYKYIQLAKKNALVDLSSEISVNISSSSILSSVETPHGFAESYSSLIKSKTKNDLEGYELVSTYDTETEYWCYYKLNKAKYKRLRGEKKEIAVSKSLDLYKRSKISRKEGRLKSAIIFNIKAIEVVKDYWNEDIEVSLDGGKILLGNELMANLNMLIAELAITPKETTIDGVRGKSIDHSLLSFVITASTGIEQEGIPVLFLYSDGRISKNKAITNNEGVVSYGFKKIKSSGNKVKFSCKVDLSELINEASSDYLLHKLLRNIIAPRGSIIISVRNPIIYISSDERILGSEYADNQVSKVLANYLIEKGFKVTDDKSKGDFEIRISANTNKVSKNADRLYTCELSVDIKMYAEDKIVYSTKVNDVFGRGSNYESASKDAYGKVNDDIEIKVGNQLYRYILD